MASIESCHDGETRFKAQTQNIPAAVQRFSTVIGSNNLLYALLCL